MNYKEGKELIVKRSNAFLDRYFKSYGQIILRLDDNSYLMSRENLLLKSVRDEDINIYDINTGDVGAIFRSRKDINAMISMTTEASVAFSSVNSRMKPALADLAAVVGTDISVSPDGSAANVLKALGQQNGCFIKGVGALGVGRSLEEAIASARIMEKSAQAEVYGKKLGGLKYIDDETAKTLYTDYRSRYSASNTDKHVEMISYSEEEFKLRNDLIACGKQMCRDELVQGTVGNLSVRLDDNYILIKPSAMDYFNIHTEDVVKVNYRTLEYDAAQRKPSTDYMLHAALYRTYPDAGAVICSHSNGCSVFAAANAGFRIGSAELTDIVGDLRSTDNFYVPGTDEYTTSVMHALYDSHSCIVANHGAAFYGKDLDVLLAIANAVESRACNLLGYGSILINDTSDADVKIYSR